MYGQGNYGTQSGQNANTSTPQIQQWSPAPAPPLPAAHASRPPMFTHGHPPGPPQVGQQGPPAYQHTHPGVHHPCPPFPVPTSGSDSSQFYPLPPPPPPPSAQVHGSTSILQSHQVPVQHSQWNPTMHQVPPSIATGAPRVLPPPPPLGQMTYRGAIHQPSPDNMQVFLHNLPPPPPLPPNLQNPSFFAPSQFDPSTHSRNHDSHVQPAVPGPRPPLPSSPPGDPPLPPSSPPLLSTTANANSAKDEGAFDHDGGIAYREGLPVNKNLASVLPSSPPKPVSLAFPGEGSSVQLINSINSAPSHSAADSDMEMEDDITQLNEDQQIHPLGAEKQLQDSLTEDMLHRNSSCCGPLESEKQRLENKTTTTSSDHYQVSISYSNNLPEEVIAGGGTLLMGVQPMLLEKAAGDDICCETWNKKEMIQVDNQKEIINSSMASIEDESPIDSKAENYEQEKRNEIDAAVNVSYDCELAKESSHNAMPCDLRISNDTYSIVSTHEPLNGERQSATEDSPSQSRGRGFVSGRIQITNVGMIPPLGRALNARSSKKLLVLDVNGLLADIVPVRYVPYSLEANIIVSGKAVFKRPFHDDFLQFCFERFHVGVWSSRIKRNMELVLDFLLGDAKHKLLFCWDQSHCTDTGFPVVGTRRSKPIILKKLKKLWDKCEPDLPWERGEYDESNTLLLDDSPHKALCNPPNTAIFPNSYHYMDEKDDSLGPGGDLRVYLEGLSMAENVQKYVESNPYGQRAITEKNASWRYYRKVIAAATYLQESGANKYSTYKCRY